MENLALTAMFLRSSLCCRFWPDKSCKPAECFWIPTYTEPQYRGIDRHQHRMPPHRLRIIANTTNCISQRSFLEVSSATNPFGPYRPARMGAAVSWMTQPPPPSPLAGSVRRFCSRRTSSQNPSVNATFHGQFVHQFSALRDASSLCATLLRPAAHSLYEIF